MGSSLVIRSATSADAMSCASVYRRYVIETAITFEVEPPAAEAFVQRIEGARAHHDWLVAERDGKVIGYAYGHPFAERAAYGWSCETSIYISRAAHRRGVGRALYEELLDRLARLGYRRAFAGITLPNPASVQLHRDFGFADSGCFRRVGWKHGAWHDVAWMQRDLQPSERDPPAPIRTEIPVAPPSGPFLGVSAVVVRDGRVLVGRRRGSHGAGTWAFPGGKLDPGETPEDAVRRELTEETGLPATHVEPISWTSEVIPAAEGALHFITLHHLVTADSGEPQLREPEKTDGWQWCAIADIPEPIFGPASSLLATGWSPPQA